MGSAFEPLNDSDNAIFSGFLGVLSGTGFLNNLVFLIVMLKRRLKSRYTMFILTNQTVVDCLVSLVIFLRVVLPSEGDGSGVVICYLWSGQLFEWLLVVVSVYCLLFTAADRYAAIVRPSTYNSGLARKVTVSVVIIYGVSIIMNMEILFEVRYTINGTCITGVLRQDAAALTFIRFYTVMWLLVQYLAPVVAMIFLYKQVYSTIAKLKSAKDSNKSSRSFTRATILNVGIFIFTNGFDSIYYMLGSFEVVPYVYNSPLQLFGLFLTSVNSAINPTIYLATMSSFRKMYAEVLLGSCRKNRVSSDLEGASF